MKKIFLFFFTIIFVSFSFTFIADAKQNATIVIESSGIEQGDSVSIDLSLSGCRKIKSFCVYDFVCDNPDIKIESGKWKSGLYILKDDLNLETNDAVIAYTKNTDFNGEIFSLELSVPETAEPGEYSVSCSAVAKTVGEDGKELSVPITVKAARIEVLPNKTINPIYNVIDNIDNSIVVSVFDKTLTDGKKESIDQLGESELDSATKDIFDSSGEKVTDDILNSNGVKNALIKKYYNAHTEMWIEKIISSENAPVIMEVVSNALNEMNIKSVDELDEGQQEAFVSLVLKGLEDNGIHPAELPKSFNAEKKVYAIDSLYKESVNKSNIKRLILVASAIMFCFVLLIVFIVIKQKKKKK